MPHRGPHRPTSLPPGSRLVLFRWLVVLFAVGQAARAAEPARAFPANGLFAYAEFDGLDTHSDAWKGTAAYAILGKTPAGAMIADIAQQVVVHLLKGQPDPKQGGADLLALHEHLLHNGISAGLYEESDRGASAVLIFQGLGQDNARERVGRIVPILKAAMARQTEGTIEAVRFRGRVLSAWKQGVPKSPTPTTPSAVRLAWWFEGDDLIVVAGPKSTQKAEAKEENSSSLPLRVELVMDAIDGNAANVASHPGRAAALAEGKDIKNFEADGLFFLEVSKSLGLYERLLKRLSDGANPIEGLTLPAGKYINDDVKFIPPPGVSLPSGTVLTPPLGVSPLVPAPPADTPAKLSVIPTPPFALAPAIPSPPSPPVAIDQNDAVRDGAVSKSEKVIGQGPAGQKKTDANIARKLGLEGVTRVVGRWGFQGKALLTDVRIDAPTPRKGLLELIQQTSFRRDHLPPIPVNTQEFLIGACDPIKACDALISLLRLPDSSVNPTGDDEEAFHMIDLLVYETTGQRLHQDILGHFGPTWCLYREPPPRRGESDPALPTLLVEVDDAREFGKVMDGMSKRVKSFLRGLMKDPQGKLDEIPPFLAMDPLPAPDRGYRLVSPAGIIPWLGKEREPTILIGKSYVAFAANLALARAGLAATTRVAEKRWTPDGETARALKCLPMELTSLTVGNPGGSTWPEWIAMLPKLVQFLANLHEAVDDTKTETSPGSKLLGILGIPQPGGFRLRIDPDQVPKVKALRDQLFPSVVATSVDAGGVRVIAREAVPFACVAPAVRFHANTKTGESIALELNPFLFPMLKIEARWSRRPGQKEGGRFLFGLLGKMSLDEDSDH